MSMKTQERKQLFSTAVAGEGRHFGVDLEMGPFTGAPWLQMKLQVEGTEMTEAESQRHRLHL